ncbi:hypothetical protein KY289_025761 [Solanum tuberosum]|nr:hypothetical protein KY289_025761 [Solanum tuberosum]
MGSSIKLGTALTNMYAKCDCLDIAKKALKLFNEMRKLKIRPDDVTFLSMFTSCSYAGMANEGLNLLNLISNVYHIEPKGVNYGCIIDVLSRAGLLEEARKIVQNMSNSSVPSDWKGTAEHTFYSRIFMLHQERKLILNWFKSMKFWRQLTII